jgi:hypothetical protein
MATGIDAAIDVGPHIAECARAGVAFIGRYYRNPGSRWAALSASEARLISSANVDIVAIFESASTKAAYFSRLAGIRDASTAIHEAQLVGQPTTSAMYFAVDYDASPPDITGCITEYFQGIHAGLHAANKDYQVGVYGSGLVCQAICDANLATYAWLAASRAWAGNQEFIDWHVRQSLTRLPGITFDHDSDEGKEDYGGFRVP